MEVLVHRAFPWRIPNNSWRIRYFLFELAMGDRYRALQPEII